MKKYTVKNYNGNLLESLTKFCESHKEVKIVEAAEKDDELKILAKESAVLDFDETKKAAKDAFVKALDKFDVKEKPNGKLVAELDDLLKGAKIGIEVQKPKEDDKIQIHMAFLFGDDVEGFYNGFGDVKTIIQGEHRYGFLKDVSALEKFITDSFVPNVLKILEFVKGSNKKPTSTFMQRFADAFKWGKTLSDKDVENMFPKR